MSKPRYTFVNKHAATLEDMAVTVPDQAVSREECAKGEIMISDHRFAAIVERARQGIPAWRGEALDHRPADPGDFGAGRYHTTFKSRAKVHAGRSGDLRRIMLRFRNAFVVDVHAAYDLAQRYGTIHGTTEQRLAAARQMTADLQAHGYDGFISVGRSELEIVTYL